MPVNEFEKQVQQKMEDLKFTPSAEVWTEVEKRIRKEKRRRRIIFWWLLPGLLLGGAAAFYYTQSKNDSPHIIQSTGPVSNEKDEPVPFTTAENKNDDDNKIEKDEKTPVERPGTVTIPVSVEPATAVKEKSIAAKTKIAAPLEPAVLPVPKKATVKQQLPAREKSLPDAEKAAAITDAATNNDLQNTEPPVQNNAATVARAEEEQKEVIAAKQEPAAADSATKTVKEEAKEEIVPESPANPVKKSKSKWQLGVGISGGGSNTLWGGLISNRAATFDASPSGQVGGGGSPAVPVILKEPRSGFSWTVEAFAHRKISPRTHLRLGIQYNQLSTSINTGSRVDSNLQVFNNISDGAFVSNYYRPEITGMPSRTYHNRYHFAGLYAGLDWAIINNKKFRLGWENGIRLTRLVATNALHYDRGRLAYYSDFEPFLKTQLFISSGFSVPLLQRKKMALSFHPSVSYGLTPVIKKNDGFNSHYIQYGAGLKYLFPSKN